MRGVVGEEGTPPAIREPRGCVQGPASWVTLHGRGGRYGTLHGRCSAAQRRALTAHARATQAGYGLATRREGGGVCARTIVLRANEVSWNARSGNAATSFALRTQCTGRIRRCSPREWRGRHPPPHKPSHAHRHTGTWARRCARKHGRARAHTRQQQTGDAGGVPGRGRPLTILRRPGPSSCPRPGSQTRPQPRHHVRIVSVHLHRGVVRRRGKVRPSAERGAGGGRARANRGDQQCVGATQGRTQGAACTARHAFARSGALGATSPGFHTPSAARVVHAVRGWRPHGAAARGRK